MPGRTGVKTDKTDQRDQILSIVEGWSMDINPGVGFMIRDKSGRKKFYVRQGRAKPTLQMGEMPVGRVTESDAWFEGDLSIHGVEYYWPTSNTDGVLTNDGSGNLSWAPGGGGTTLYDAMLLVRALANGLDLLFGVEPRRFRSLVDGAELRAKGIPLTSTEQYLDLRTAAEGGSFVGTGTDEILKADFDCGPLGTNYAKTASTQTRWFYTWRVHLATGGTGTWTLWSSGEEDPQYVTDYVDTTQASDTGPPQGWTPTIRAGPYPYTCIVRASRPITNSNVILGVSFQIRDKNTGSRRNVDANAGSAVVYYDGSSTTTTTYNRATGLFTVDSSLGSAAVGDLILMDVRQGSFNHKYCQWGTVQAITTNTVKCFGFRPAFAPTGDSYTNVRIKVVKPPWVWPYTDGFFGALPGGGMDSQWFVTAFANGDLTSEWFESAPIPYDTGLAISDLEGRAFFENIYSRSDDETWSGNIPGTGDTPWIIYLEDAATVILDASLGCMFQVTLGGNRTLSVINAKDGQPIGLRIVQGGSGSYTLTLPGNFVWGEAVPVDSWAMGDTVGNCDYIGFVYHEADSEFHVVAVPNKYTT